MVAFGFYSIDAVLLSGDKLGGHLPYLVIPFLGGFALTLLKLVADQKLLSFDESNDIALDMVLLGVGALALSTSSMGRWKL